MTISVVFCADDTQRAQATAVLQAANNTVTTFTAADSMATTSTVAADGTLAQQAVYAVKYVLVGVPPATAAP
jgi:hypothetical protein